MIGAGTMAREEPQPEATNRRKAVQEQFDKDAPTYLAKHLTPENVQQLRRVVELLDRGSRYANTLDIGCGPGTLSEDLLTKSDQVWGIDISEQMIATARKKYHDAPFATRLHFKTGDAENLPFPDQHFDAVVCLGVLRYLPSWQKGLREIHRVLKPDGVAIMSFYYRFSPHWVSMNCVYRPLLPFISVLKGRSFKESLVRYRAEPLPFSYREFAKVFAQTGFGTMELRHSGFDVFPLNRLFPRVSRYCYLKADGALFNSPFLGWLGSICLVKGVKKAQGRASASVPVAANGCVERESPFAG